MCITYALAPGTHVYDCASRKKGQLWLGQHKCHSTCTWLKLAVAPRRTMSRQSGGATAASEVITHSMVAILGWIMPEPLAKPPTRTGTPPMSA